MPLYSESKQLQPYELWWLPKSGCVRLRVAADPLSKALEARGTGLWGPRDKPAVIEVDVIISGLVAIPVTRIRTAQMHKYTIQKVVFIAA